MISNSNSKLDSNLNKIVKVNSRPKLNRHRRRRNPIKIRRKRKASRRKSSHKNSTNNKRSRKYLSKLGYSINLTMN